MSPIKVPQITQDFWIMDLSYMCSERVGGYNILFEEVSIDEYLGQHYSATLKIVYSAFFAYFIEQTESLPSLSLL